MATDDDKAMMQAFMLEYATSDDARPMPEAWREFKRIRQVMEPGDTLKIGSASVFVMGKTWEQGITYHWRDGQCWQDRVWYGERLWNEMPDEVCTELGIVPQEHGGRLRDMEGGG